MLMLAKDLDARSLAVVWDRGQVAWAVPDTRREVLKYLYDKVSLCLTALAAHGVVIADEPGGGSAEHRAWLAETLPLTDEGTYYTKPERILLPITTAPSNHIPHLQLADLIAGATTGAIAGNRYALELLPELKALSHRNSHGRIGGAGLTLWPPDLGLTRFRSEFCRNLRRQCVGNRVGVCSGLSGNGRQIGVVARR